VPRPGDVLTLAIEKPAAGGRMLARHDGQVALVAGAIPGERVAARVEQVRGGVLFARVEHIDEASPDRRSGDVDPGCGGSFYAHIAYERQLSLKREIVLDAFQRIGKLAVECPVEVHGSPEHGYRMRARLHVHGHRIGFYREATHDLCDPATSRQLLDSTLDLIAGVSKALGDGKIESGATLDLSENVDASERAILLDLKADARERGRWNGLLGIAGATGVAIARGGRLVTGRGDPVVHDVVAAPGGASSAGVRLGRHVGAFFQGNRHLLQTLVDRVLTFVPDGPLCDLYAGSGLFGVTYAATGRGEVDAVEADALAADDLRVNAMPYADRLRVHRAPVERFLAARGALDGRTVILDPPRTGLSPESCELVAAAGAGRVIYVSCDPATLARDARRLTSGGYRLSALEVFDLFPVTPHVETLGVFDR
jgi:23S rRNA (uracil1939-C5)-methyltransferase